MTGLRMLPGIVSTMGILVGISHFPINKGREAQWFVQN